jgi:type III restriction enzyme
MFNILKNFQKVAVSNLIDSCSSLLDKSNRQSVCVLCAPTGSGKTVMAAAFIEGLIARREDEICFIWVTIGKGELQIQSRNSLRRYFNGSPRVSLVDSEFHGGRQEISANEVVVVNWEKIRNKEKATGEWKNLLMKDGERTNFREVLENTRQKRKIILIIDESHIGSSAERTIELKEEVDADVVLEISATPKFKPSPNDMSLGLAHWIQVPAKDVIDEGMIKKEIIINERLDELSDNEIDSQTAVLEMAYQKRIAIQEAFDTSGVDINPLVLIQIPNAEEGDRKIDAIIDFLAARDITEGNSRLAIWLNDYPSSENLDRIVENTNPIQFLIFKQAIDTGWDCPRAHILVKFRETKSEVFEIQVLGRILRMPEQKHYDLDILNNGYVFTNIPKITVNKEEYNPNIIKHIKSKRIGSYKNISLPSYYKSRADYGDITGEFVQIFCKSSEKHFGIQRLSPVEENIQKAISKGLNLDVSKLKESIISDYEIASTSFDSIDGDLDSSHTVDLLSSDNDTQFTFNHFLESHMGTFTNKKRSLPIMKSALYALFKNYFSIGGPRQDATWLQNTVLEKSNKVHFDHIFTDAVEQFAIFRELEVKKRVEGGEQNYIFEVPSEIYINEFVEEVVPYLKNVMHPCYLEIERSQPEKLFEKFLEADSKIEWWFKNGINKIEYFGVKYEYPTNRIKTFYPDYIVMYLDGTLGIFETKSNGDDENLGGLNQKTKAKAEALQIWRTSYATAGRSVRAGVVIISGNIIRINENSTFDTEKAINGDWADWQQFQ